MKSRGVYETPGGTVLYEAHLALERLILDRDTMQYKNIVAQKFSQLCYDGLWFTPLMDAINAFVDKTQEEVTGKVRMKLYKGCATAVASQSPNSLYSEEFATFSKDDVYTQSDATGFINLFSLPLKIRAIQKQNEEGGRNLETWKGRFTKASTSSSDEFNASITFDKRLYKEDIAGSIAHAKMLSRQGILTKEEESQIVSALLLIEQDIDEGKVEFTIEGEDIHMNIETLLTNRIGATGKKLHTARSRNDQVAVDFKLHIKKEILEIDHLLDALLGTLKELAEKHTETAMPGYTHLQRAQPVTFAFHLLAYYQMFLRDKDRFADCYKRTDYLPLGSGALAGTSYVTDREFLAEELGFAYIAPNAMDAVSDRDFAIEFISCCSVCMMHLSRFARN